jgi:CRP-like cAMP-binding protein
MPRSTTAASLATTDLGRGLTPAESQVLFDLSDEVTLAAGARLFEDGAASNAVYIVVSGEVEVLKKDPSGHEQAISAVTSGGVLGEMSLVNPGARRSAAARARGPVVLLRIHAAAFEPLLAQGNVAALKVVSNFAQTMAKRLASLSERVVGLMGEKAEGKHQELKEFQSILSHWSF